MSDTTAPKTHIVLVPGFGGFDALGQIFYYAGVTIAYEKWCQETLKQSAHPALALHYFESLPTAGVRSRAMALRAYLEEHVFRGVFGPDDRVALVGHSTGALDIRQLLVNLNGELAGFDELRDRPKKRLVDDQAIFSKVKRLVFLSAPHFGTNLGDFGLRYETLIALAFASVQRLLVASRIEALETVSRWLLDRARAWRGEPQIFSAIRDALRETIAPDNPSTPSERYAGALSTVAYGELLSWVEHVSTDLFALRDLACRGPANTPARYPADLRAAEQKAWGDNETKTLSFATVAKAPYAHTRTEPFPFLPLRWLLSARRPTRGTDYVFRLAHAATAAGDHPVPHGEATLFPDGGPRVLSSWENDGVVNTTSMLWPNGVDTQLVVADHGDIIGHYLRSEAIKESEVAVGRELHSYDIFGSSFEPFDRFDKVWQRIFTFCAT